MGLFSKKNKDIPTSGGNLFNNYVDIEAAKNIQEINMKIDNSVFDNQFSEYIIDEYFLMLNYANYFKNTLDYQSTNISLFNEIRKVVHLAFFYGQSAIIYDDWTLSTPLIYAVNIVNTKYDVVGNLVEFSYSSATEAINNQLEKFKPTTIEKLDKKYLKNVCIFKWNMQAYGAWVWLYKFIKQQKVLLEMLFTSSFSYIKKFELNVSNPLALADELKNFFNTSNPFIVNARLGNKFNNNIKVLEQSGLGTDPLNLLEFYERYTNIYNEMFGRRDNVDTKKERNVSNEVAASQEIFIASQQEYKTNFYLFISALNKFLDVDKVEMTNDLKSEDNESSNDLKSEDNESSNDLKSEDNESSNDLKSEEKDEKNDI